MMASRHEAVSPAESLSLTNSDAGLFRQFDTIMSDAEWRKHQLVPSVITTLLLCLKWLAALSNAIFALSRKVSMSSRANEV